MMPRCFCLLVSLLLQIAPAWADGALHPQRVTEGVYVMRGVSAAPSALNGGAVINTGFIVGTEGVVVVDSGPHYRYGKAMLTAIRGVTRKPVRLLINTHAHPENVLGNRAFAERGIPVLATARTRQLMRERCPACVKNFSRQLGREWMKGTRIVLPGKTVSGSAGLSVAGLRLRLIDNGWAHTESDLSVFDEGSGVLFTGGLVYVKEIPHMREASVKGWLKALASLGELPLRHVVPGQGAAGGGETLDGVLGYLRALDRFAQAALARGVDASAILAGSEMPAYADWALYAERHPLNVQRAFTELEAAAWGARK